jgi:hypothetical protein
MYDSEVSTYTEVNLVQPIVFPVVLYVCKSWTLRTAEKREVNAFELWMWKRLLKIPWAVRRTNASVINKIKPKHSLETVSITSKMKYFGHIMCRLASMAKYLKLGLTDRWR